MAEEKILVVDDEADILDLCQHILTSKGFQVRTAHDGPEAIEIARQEDFDLLLTDIKLPGLNGLEIVQALKKLDQNLICIIMTGYSAMDMVIDALKLGVDEYIMKPFSPEELILVVNKAVEKEQLRQENSRLHSLIPLFELNKTLMGTVEVGEVLQRLFEIAQTETRADLARLYTFDQGEIKLFYSHPAESGDSPAGQACDKLAQFIFKDGRQLAMSRSQVGHEARPDLLEELDAQAVIAIPLKSQNSDLGTLILVRVEEDFAPSDIDFLAVLSGQASIALENARLFTKIQEAYQELQTLDDMKSEFINIAAHELRTPLAILVGYTTILEEELEGPPREYLTNIMRNALRLRSLIDDMLSLQYLESGLASLSQDELDLPEVIGDVIQDMSLIASEKKLDIKVDIPLDFPPMIGDRYKLDLILVNLIHNAVKFTPSGGQVTLKAKVEGDQAVMSVSNTGSFIPKNELTRIFDRFYQVESSLTREHGGIGLGLSIVKGMVEVCGGQIWVESEPERGTTFTFSLPLINTFPQ